MTETGGASLVIHAEPEEVWGMVSDVTRMGEWSSETERAEWLDGATGPAVGARFKGYNRRGRTRWSTVCEVIEADPGRAFAFAVGGAAKPETIWRYRFEPAEYRLGRLRTSRDLTAVSYAGARWSGGASYRLVVRPGEPIRPAERDVWLTSRWRAYTRRFGRIWETPVEHEPWPLCEATVDAVEETLTRAAGLPVPGAEPLAHFSPGVRHVRLGRPRPCTTEVERGGARERSR